MMALTPAEFQQAVARRKTLSRIRLESTENKCLAMRAQLRGIERRAKARDALRMWLQTVLSWS